MEGSFLVKGLTGAGGFMICMLLSTMLLLREHWQCAWVCTQSYLCQNFVSKTVIKRIRIAALF